MILLQSTLRFIIFVNLGRRAHATPAITIIIRNMNTEIRNRTKIHLKPDIGGVWKPVYGPIYRISDICRQSRDLITLFFQVNPQYGSLVNLGKEQLALCIYSKCY